VERGVGSFAEGGETGAEIGESVVWLFRDHCSPVAGESAVKVEILQRR